MIAGSLEIQMSASLARLSDDMKKTQTIVGSTMKNVESSVASAKKVLGALGIGLGVGYFVTLIKGSIDAMDRLRDLSKTTNITVESLAGLKLAAQQNRMIDKLKRKGKSDQSAEDKAREQAEFLAGCTKEFSSNIEYPNGSGASLTGEALHKAVYSDTSIGFIAEQVGKHLGEWGNFKTGSPKP